MFALFGKLFRRKPKRHYPKDWDGHLYTCNCGYRHAWDWDLRVHFATEGRVGR